MEEIIKRELYFIEALYRIHERLMLILLSIKEQREFIDSEEMRSILEPIHKAWFMGEYMFHLTELDLPPENPMQQGLFGQVVMQNSEKSDMWQEELDGTNVEPLKENTKKI